MPSKKDDVPSKRRYLSSAARKEEILDAALVEFSDRTYNAVTMERLAECAGLSKAGIYAHFKSKEEIFHALLERLTKQLRDFQGWLPDEDLTLPELVDSILIACTPRLAHPPLYRSIVYFWPKAPEHRNSCGVGVRTLRTGCESGHRSSSSAT